MLVLKKKIKDWCLLTFLVCPDGLGIAIIGGVWEIIYRFAVYFGYLHAGLEWFSVIAGFVVFLWLLIFRLLRGMFRMRKSKTGHDEIK